MTEVFDNNILIGWYGTTNGHNGPMKVFIPRRDEDVEADRAQITALFRRIRKGR